MHLVPRFTQCDPDLKLQGVSLPLPHVKGIMIPSDVQDAAVLQPRLLRERVECPSVLLHQRRGLSETSSAAPHISCSPEHGSRLFTARITIAICKKN